MILNPNNYSCIECNSKDVEIDNSCQCVVVDIKCKACGAESYAIREDLEQDFSDGNKSLIDKILDESSAQEMREIVAEFTKDIPKAQLLNEDERNELFDDMLKMLEGKDADKTELSSGQTDSEQ